MCVFPHPIDPGLPEFSPVELRLVVRGLPSRLQCLVALNRLNFYELPLSGRVRFSVSPGTLQHSTNNLSTSSHAKAPRFVRRRKTFSSAEKTQMLPQRGERHTSSQKHESHNAFRSNLDHRHIVIVSASATQGFLAISPAKPLTMFT